EDEDTTAHQLEASTSDVTLEWTTCRDRRGRHRGGGEGGGRGDDRQSATRGGVEDLGTAAK
ncbi:hypothetical protein HN873_023861, partial [Arachis hypogaea]